jgi:hypothetical protein
MVKLLMVNTSEARQSPADGGVADVCLRSPNARMRNRRNEARLLLFAFSDSEHGRDYKRGCSDGQTTGRARRRPTNVRGGN